MTGISSDRVSAVIVTRGDVDIQPVIDSLIFDEVVVWNNAAEPEDAMTYGRVLALDLCSHSVVFSIDDDIVHTPQNQRAILAAYEPGVLTGCMWPEWSDGARRQGIEHGYDDLVFPGSGAVYHRSVPQIAVDKYLRFFPLDDFFRLWCDTIVGIVAPNRQLDIRFDSLPHAEAGNGRMCDLPNAVELKTEAISRARYVRAMTGKPDAHDHYFGMVAAGHISEHRYL